MIQLITGKRILITAEPLSRLSVTRIMMSSRQLIDDQLPGNAVSDVVIGRVLVYQPPETAFHYICHQKQSNLLSATGNRVTFYLPPEAE